MWIASFLFLYMGIIWKLQDAKVMSSCLEFQSHQLLYVLNFVHIFYISSLFKIFPLSSLEFPNHHEQSAVHVISLVWLFPSWMFLLLWKSTLFKNTNSSFHFQVLVGFTPEKPSSYDLVHHCIPDSHSFLNNLENSITNKYNLITLISH